MKSRKLIILIIGGVIFIGLAVLVYARVKSNLDASNKQNFSMSVLFPQRNNLQRPPGHHDDDQCLQRDEVAWIIAVIE